MGYAQLKLVRVEVKQIEGVFKTQNHFGTVLRPEHIFEVRAQVNASDYVKVVPVIESDKILAANSQQSSTVDALIAECCLEGLVFTKIFVDLN